MSGELPCDLCLMREVVYGLLPWERKLVDVMMEDFFSWAKTIFQTTITGVRTFATSAHEMPLHSLTACYWIHWEVI